MPDLDAVRRRPALSLAATVATIAVLMTLGSQLGPGLPEPVGHALSHLFVGVPVGVLLWFVVRSWPPARSVRPGHLSRRLVVVGSSGIVVGQLLEILGARVDEPDATWEGVAHTAGMIVTNLSLLAAVVGGALAMVAAARAGAVPRWAAASVVVLLVVAFGFMTLGSPDAG